MSSHREAAPSRPVSLSSQPPGRVELGGRERSAVRRLEVLHVLLSLVVESTVGMEEASRQKDVGGE